MCYDVDDNNEGCRVGRRGHRASTDDEKATRIDFSLIHDIVPQRGGNYEPLDAEEDILRSSLIRTRCSDVKVS